MLDANLSIHLIGIGGSGISAIARLLLESGYHVTGSDRSLTPLARELAAAGVTISVGHRPENVRGAGLVVRSSAVPDDNVEVQAALQAGIPVLKRAQFLGQLLENHFAIAVAGTHGKTTTTAMIAWILVALGQDPSYIIGGTAKNLGGKNAHAGKGPAFVIEADEYDRMFLGLRPDVIVITSLEHDHPDCFPTPEIYVQAFVDFVHNLRPGGIVLAAADQVEASQIARLAQEGLYTYGTSPQADYLAENLTTNPHGGYDYDACWKGPDGEKTHLAHVSLQVPGEHNVRNSLAALAAFHRAGQAASDPALLEKAAQALAAFTGTGRRFDVLGEVNGITIIDDYAHHPTKVQATLLAARARYPERRIWAVWQPHTYSRTISFMDEFARSFSAADRVLVTEVYAAREKAADFENFSAAQVVGHMTHPGAQFIAGLEETGDYLLQNLHPGDVVVVLSAGDADQIGARVFAALRERNGQNA
jgi:UDP-N-acetylmuramate--alanine ligase